MSEKKTDVIEQSHDCLKYREVVYDSELKKTWAGFNQETGVEVAWNEIYLKNFPDLTIENLQNRFEKCNELSHPSIIFFGNSWPNEKTQTFTYTTEFLVSGTLHTHLNIYSKISKKVVKKWATQILEGIEYLHSLDPPIVHKSINPDNIYVDGKEGSVKLGDIGLISVGDRYLIETWIRNPIYLAPEFIDNDYNEKIDIYSFGLCLLELSTNEVPYSECKNSGQIMKKQIMGQPPESLSKVQDENLKKVILLCIQDKNKRPSAKKLLKNEFFSNFRANHTNKSQSPKRKKETKEKEEKKQPIEKKEINIAIDVMLNGKSKKLSFPFVIGVDTAESLANEIITQVKVSDDMPSLVKQINSKIKIVKNPKEKRKEKKKSKEKTEKNKIKKKNENESESESGSGSESENKSENESENENENENENESENESGNETGNKSESENKSGNESKNENKSENENGNESENEDKSGSGSGNEREDENLINIRKKDNDNKKNIKVEEENNNKIMEEEDLIQFNDDEISTTKDKEPTQTNNPNNNPRKTELEVLNSVFSNMSPDTKDNQEKIIQDQENKKYPQVLLQDLTQNLQKIQEEYLKEKEKLTHQRDQKILELKKLLTLSQTTEQQTNPIETTSPNLPKKSNTSNTNDNLNNKTNIKDFSNLLDNLEPWYQKNEKK
ncbi:wnk kinase isoform m [Anaeramoeba flamelloides]|uniref:Wnk kinase isoform m n=1 Tax=Anaeramoeba flamelloides TaxID=1746091 RepID=A0AAV7YMY5_9EUKA|nr:wnk kinase isoform m [Anaeramoeba flamelloides]